MSVEQQTDSKFSFPNFDNNADSSQEPPQEQNSAEDLQAQKDREIYEAVKRTEEQKKRQEEVDQLQKEIALLEKFKKEDLPKIEEEQNNAYYQELFQEKFQTKQAEESFGNLLKSLQEKIGPLSYSFMQYFLEEAPNGDAVINYLNENDSENLIKFLEPFFDVVDESKNPLYRKENGYRAFMADEEYRLGMIRQFENTMKRQMRKVSKKIYGNSDTDVRRTNPAKSMAYNPQSGGSQINIGRNRADRLYEHTTQYIYF